MTEPIKTEIFITAITAPTLSNKYMETSCTAGFDRAGNWKRIYPVPLRKLDKHKSYRKYQWVCLDTFPATNDPRPESLKCNHDSIQITSDKIPDWEERKKICLSNGQKIYVNFDELLEEASERPIKTSLAVFKPSEILSCFASDITKTEIEEALNKQNKITENYQMELNFSEDDKEFVLADPPRIKLKYSFLDSKGKKHTLSVLDWEAYMLYRNLISSGHDHTAAKSLTVQKYESLIENSDLYFFLGTRKEDHIRKLNQPFSIIGVFYPPKSQDQKEKECGQQFLNF